MEISKAKEALTEILKAYSIKIEETGAKCVADVYFCDDRGITTSVELDEISESLCASITVYHEDAKDENDKCGFDIILSISNDKDISDKELETALSEFEADIDVFVENLLAAEDKNSFIKAEAEKEKNEYYEKMNKFNKDIKKLQTISFCLLGVVTIILVIGVFALISSL